VERKNEILSKAWNLFQEHGYRHVTMDHIAKSCQVARTTLYEYFSNKEDILLTLAENISNDVHSVTIKGETFAQCLEWLIIEYLKRIQNNRSLYQIIFQEAPALSPNIAARLLEWRAKFDDQIRRIAEKGKEREEIREEVFVKDVCFLCQAVIGQRAGDMLMKQEVVDPHTEALYLVDLILYGIKAY
jgi:AcrR family transcriptional regulator